MDNVITLHYVQEGDEMVRDGILHQQMEQENNKVLSQLELDLWISSSDDEEVGASTVENIGRGEGSHFGRVPVSASSRMPAFWFMDDSSVPPTPATPVDSHLSAMDVSGLLESGRSSKVSGRRVGMKRNSIIETPSIPSGELRRSTRKRTLTEAFQTYSTSVQAQKRQKLENSHIEVSNEKWEIVQLTPVPQKAGETPKIPKIILRRIKPVNRIVVNKQAYKKGLIRKGEHTAADLYSGRGQDPKVLRSVLLSTDDDDPLKLIANQVTPTITQTKENMRYELMQEQTLIANYHAHGQGVLDKTGVKLTPNKEHIQGSFPMFNLDNQFEKLLSIQGKAMKELLEKRNTKGEFSPSKQNPFEFLNPGFGADSDKKEKKKSERKHAKITGAVPVTRNGYRNNPEFFEHRTVFNFEGDLYRLNQPVIVVVKTPDDVLEAMQAPRTKATMDSLYYKEMTTYFEKLDARKKAAAEANKPTVKGG